ncbi:MAG: type II 3-dehydroquinate dehydratase [Rickettsiales bacterium]
MERMRVLVVNGPNINMLGTREPDNYGSATFDDLSALLVSTARRLDCDLSHFQSNGEGEIVSVIQKARGKFDALVLNAGAFTHTSVAVRDAVLAAGVKMMEVHISNIYKREPFRHVSYLSDVAECVICGAGIHGYALAMEYAAEIHKHANDF